MPPALSSYLHQAQALAPGWWILAGVFTLCWLAQFWFWVARLGKVAAYRPEREPAAPSQALPLSVVVCCHNDGLGLRRLLTAVQAQDYPVYELVVVDDRSDDETYDWLLAEARRRDAPFRLVRVNARPEHVSGKKYALTLGIKAARHEHLLLTDADCLPASSHWISRMAAGFGRGRVALGYSPYARRPGLLNALIRYDTFYTALQYAGFALAGRPYMGVGRNLAYDRSLFLSAKGFAAHAGKAGGDDDLFINQAVREGRAGAVTLCLHPEAQTVSEPKETFGQWFRQKRRHLSAGRSYHSADKLALGLLQGSHVGFYLAGLLLLAAPPLTLWVAFAFTARLPLTWMVQYKAARRLGDRFAPLSLPLLDAWMPVHYLLFGIPALLSKRTSWI